MEQSKPQFFKGFIISFLRFSECTFDTKEEGTFKDHVIENYPSNFELFSAMSLPLALLRIEFLSSFLPSSAFTQNLDKNHNLDKQINSLHIEITFCYQVTFRM